MPRLRVPGLLIAAVLAIAACGGSASPAPSAGASVAPTTSTPGACAVAPEGTTPAATVTIRDFRYDPGSVTIKAGETVAWTNEDTASHTATTLDGACDTGSISKGGTVALVFPEAGTYTYHCTIHASMPNATIEVTE